MDRKINIKKEINGVVKKWIRYPLKFVISFVMNYKLRSSQPLTNRITALHKHGNGI